MKKKMTIKNLTEKLKYHVVDSTAIITAINPVMSVVEKTVNGMSNDVSINARILGTAITYGGLGSLYSKGRDLSRNFFGIRAQATEKIKQVHDTLYSIAYAAAVTPPFYYVAGSRDFREIAIGTFATMGVGFVMGGPMGYSIDAFRDLTGLKESERVPELVKSQDSKIKKSIATALVVASIGVMGLIYKVRL